MYKCTGVQVYRCTAHLYHDEILVIPFLNGLPSQLLQLLLVQIKGDEGFLRDLGREWKLR